MAEVIGDLDNRRYGLMHLAEKFQAHGAGVGVGAVQDEARRGDDAVAALLLDAGQPGQKLVGHVLAQPRLAERAAGYGQDFRCAMRCFAVYFKTVDAETGAGYVVNFAEVVVQPLDFHPQTVGRNHAP